MSAPRSVRLRQGLRALRRFGAFFVLMCFVITCCMSLFLGTMTGVTGWVLEKEHIQAAATVTFINVVFLSLLCVSIDVIRRHFFVVRPVRHITRAAGKVMAGDLSVRIAPLFRGDPDNEFNIIISYFNRMVEELSKVETLRTDFIANVSHELKTPLAVMQNYGAMLAQPQLDEDKRAQYAKTLADAARRLADMVTNILKLNKLENQSVYPDTQTYDLGDQLCQCLLAFEDAVDAKGLEIRADIADNVRITADPELLRLVWNNLLSNAVKFTEAGGTVAVSLAETDEGVTVQVRDTGCGIPPEVGAHIFEKFYQGDTSHATQGNGLGLALVKRVIDIVGGEIAVSSAVGAGSRFTVTLRNAPDETG